MTTPVLHTYRDAIEHLRGWADALPSGAEDRRLHAAVQSAYEDVVSDSRWRFFTSHYRLPLSPVQETGTVAYDYATKTATLSGATVPAWARQAHVLFGTDQRIYKVAERTGETTFTLEEGFAPYADVDAGTSYKLFRSVYPLPADFLGISGVEDERSQWRPTYVASLDEWLYRERQLTFRGRPFFWTIAGHPDLYGQSAVFMAGYPTETATLDMIYHRAARGLVLDGFSFYSSQGTARVDEANASEATATFTNLSLPSGAAGAVLRLSATGATEPPSSLGTTRYSEQRIISAVTDVDTVTVDSAWSIGKQGDHFTISDPLDLPRYLLDAFYRGCEHYLAMAAIPARVGDTQALYVKSLKKARAVEGRMPRDDGHSWRHPAWGMIYGVVRIGAREA